MKSNLKWRRPRPDEKEFSGIDPKILRRCWTAPGFFLWPEPTKRESDRNEREEAGRCALRYMVNGTAKVTVPKGESAIPFISSLFIKGAWTETERYPFRPYGSRVPDVLDMVVLKKADMVLF